MLNRFWDEMGSGIGTPSPAFFSSVRYRSPIAPFNKISRYFQNIAILSIISRYLDENHMDTYLNIHSPKNRYYRRYFADNIDI
ncbi:unnamed protein product [Malus baccata var. baccata]